MRCPPAPPRLCTPPSPRTALQRVRRSAPERRRERTGLRACRVVRLWKPRRLRSAPHHSASACRPSPPACARVRTKVTGTELEKRISEACSNKPWGASSTMLAEIAQSTYDYQEYPVVMQNVWKRVNESGRNWRIVYKALTTKPDPNH